MVRRMLYPKPDRPRKVSRKESREVYDAVLRRDGSCVGPRLDPGIDACSGWLERDHVPKVSRKARREETSLGTVVLLCRHHHQDGWATSHRPLLRDFLAEG